MFVRSCLWIAVLFQLTLTTQAVAAQLPVKQVKASSNLPDSMGTSFAPANAADGKAGTFWSEGEPSAGLGEWIDFNFGDEVTISRIEIFNGNWDSRDFYQRHNRIKSMQVKFPNGTSQRFDIPDKMERQILTLTAPVKTKSVRFVLKEVYEGTTFNDTYLSEVLFFNQLPGPVVENIKVKASSSLPNDAAASYLPSNALDGVQDTIWCEAKKGSGVGEWIQLTLPKATTLKELRLLNGVAVTEETYQKNSRATKLRIELGGGVVKEVSIPEQFGVVQIIPLENATGSIIKLTILEETAGKSFSDTCISEIQAVPGS